MAPLAGRLSLRCAFPGVPRALPSRRLVLLLVGHLLVRGPHREGAGLPTDRGLRSTRAPVVARARSPPGASGVEVTPALVTQGSGEGTWRSRLGRGRPRSPGSEPEATALSCPAGNRLWPQGVRPCGSPEAEDGGGRPGPASTVRRSFWKHRAGHGSHASVSLGTFHLGETVSASGGTPGGSEGIC